ncbi:GNAT family N-acetyltransferase [Streptomyces sp. NPDC051561]|uniref:GNAT family N-acetyltransferase n=1 Tax=Streptomyces sp. NPDC051561 TaxID=3365658 RepID=UPI0037B5737D
MLSVPLGENALLKPLEPWSAPEFLAHIERARPTVDPWIPWATFTTDLPSATATLQRYADRQVADTGRIYGIWLDGTLVGGVMFPRFDAASGVCEIGCWTEAAGEGHGLVTRACRMLVDWAFGERGMSRIEWVAPVGNTRSIAVARRLGMTKEGVQRKLSPYSPSGGPDGVRQDCELWSLLAEEWGAAGTEGAGGTEAVEAGERVTAVEAEESVAAVEAELDRLMGVFMGAFTNTGGRRPDLEVIREVFVPQGTIVSNVGDKPVFYDLDSFIEPRQRMLSDGTLTEFSEWETVAHTKVFGSVAHRFSQYRKSGVRDGGHFEGAGGKTTQFLRTAEGWRISSMAWDDVPG